MHQALTGLAQRYKTCFRDPEYVWSFLLGLVFLVVGIAASIFAILYATSAASNSVTDLILSNIPVFNVDAAFVYGPLIFWLVVILYTAWHPERLPFVLKSLAVFPHHPLGLREFDPYFALPDACRGRFVRIPFRLYDRQGPVLLRPHRIAVHDCDDLLAR